jgi:hypothetical protein
VSIFSETRLRQAQPERFDIHIERIFPLTLSSSKGIFAFFDSLLRERGQNVLVPIRDSPLPLERLSIFETTREPPPNPSPAQLAGEDQR